ncbi:DivIVA domain-containing protein [Rugosimonospora acidiphila]
MHPQEVTGAKFRRRWFWFGLDAAEVRAFLGRIADVLAARDQMERALRQEILHLRSENERIKLGLRRWQAEQYSTHRRR